MQPVAIRYRTESDQIPYLALCDEHDDQYVLLRDISGVDHAMPSSTEVKEWVELLAFTPPPTRLYSLFEGGLLLVVCEENHEEFLSLYPTSGLGLQEDDEVQTRDQQSCLLL
jgi:hypothetical protein